MTGGVFLHIEKAPVVCGLRGRSEWKIKKYEMDYMKRKFMRK